MNSLVGLEELVGTPLNIRVFRKLMGGLSLSLPNFLGYENWPQKFIGP
jgi:hypothetical protein